MSELKMKTGPSKHDVIQGYLADRQRIKQRIYELRLNEIYDFGLSVGIVRDVLKAKNKRWKLLWGALAVLAFGMCTKELVTLFGNFMDNPTNTKISYKVNSSLEFPQVSICTFARVNATKISNMGISNDLLGYMLSSFKGMYLFYNDINVRQQAERLERAYQNFLRHQEANFSLTRFFIRNGFDCSKFLKACMFQGTDFDCCSGKEILSDVGKCFVVSSRKFPAQTIPGPSGGLKIFINNYASEYPETFVNTNPDSGIQIHIIHPDEKSALVGVSPLIIFPDTHAMVRLNGVHRKLRRTSRPDSCTHTHSLKYFEQYSYEGCFTECVARMTLKTCGCIQIGSVPNYELLDRSQLCSPERATTCVQPLLQANTMGFLWDIYDIKSNCNCPLPCNQFYYETSVSYSTVPNPAYKRARARIESGVTESNMTFESPDNIILDLFFDNLQYTEITESDAISSTIFLSNIGGQLSIWLGVRLITLVHLLYYLAFSVVHLVPIWFQQIGREWRRIRNKRSLLDENYQKFALESRYLRHKRRRGRSRVRPTNHFIPHQQPINDLKEPTEKQEASRRRSFSSENIQKHSNTIDLSFNKNSLPDSDPELYFQG